MNAISMTVRGKERLVGGHDRLAGGKCRLDRAPGWIAGPADHLDQDVDRRVGGQFHGIGNPAEFLQIDVALLAPRTRADGDDLDRAAAARQKLVALMLQQADDGRADSPQSGKTDFQRFGHETSLT